MFSLSSSGYLNPSAGTFAPVGKVNGFALVVYNINAPVGQSIGTFNYGQVGYADTASTRTLLAAAVNNGAVPEPATLAMLLTGFGAAGAVMRRRCAAVVRTAFA